MQRDRLVLGVDHHAMKPTNSSVPTRPAASKSLRIRLWVAAAVALCCAVVGVVAIGGQDATARLHQNESTAIATLKNICSAQAQMQASGAIDVDGNGAGEYGFFAELAGRVVLRGGDAPMSPPVLSERFANVRSSQVVAAGYVFQMFLPDARGNGVAEDDTGGDPANDNGVDPARAEVTWCCYAWPVERGRTGNRVFFVNQGGDVLAARGFGNGDGERAPCHWGAAFAAGPELHLGCKVAANTLGQDGNTWTVI